MSPSHLHKSALRLRTGEQFRLTAAALSLTSATGPAGDFSAPANWFASHVPACGRRETTARRVAGVNGWLNFLAGGAAMKAASSPAHFAMSDRMGDTCAVDQDSYSVSCADTNGPIHPKAGAHTGSFNGNGPDVATNPQRNHPREIWLRGDGRLMCQLPATPVARRLPCQETRPSRPEMGRRVPPPEAAKAATVLPAAADIKG